MFNGISICSKSAYMTFQSICPRIDALWNATGSAAHPRMVEYMPDILLSSIFEDLLVGHLKRVLVLKEVEKTFRIF